MHCVLLWLAVIVAMLWPASMWAQYTESVLYSFCQQGGLCPDGDNPEDATPIFDSQGNLYGTAFGGGANNGGAVYELTPPPGGSGPWTETLLYSFCQLSGCPDGQNPAAGLIFDSNGNLYGTTRNGGNSNQGGVVFELSPPAGGHGPWTEKILYSFCSNGQCSDGKSPLAGLIFDSHGNLYGNTNEGGAHGAAGAVFELSPAGGGTWTESVLYSFCGASGCTDGESPVAGLIFDSAGNLYGTTSGGGAHGGGEVFELSPAGGGRWTFNLLYSFCSASNCTDGESPVAGVIFDSSQTNLYGTAPGGGANAYGVAFELSPAGGGTWTESVLQNFCPAPCSNGSYPQGGLIFDSRGNLFGTTYDGGSNDQGVVFELSPSGGGHWTETEIHTFTGVPDGAFPSSSLIFDSQGNLYGTAGAGAHGAGAVYELSPPPLIPTMTALMTSPNPSNVGQVVTMTATVTAHDGSLPTGTVVFKSNGVSIGSAPLNNSGVAVLDYAGLQVGTDNLVAMYQGSSTLAPSTSNTVVQVVNPDVSTTAVTSAPNPSIFGQQVTITATVSPSGPPAPTGTVGFTSNGTGISGCTAVTLASGMAVCKSSTLPVGTDMIVATYSGDSNYMGSSGMLTQIVNPVPVALQFVPAPPCRVVDTRNPNGTFGGPPINGNTTRSFPLSEGDNPCGIPSSAVAYSLNVTVVPEQTLGYLTIWPTGEGQPLVSTLNSPDGRIKANAAIVPAGTPSGSVSIYVTDTTNVILDIDGYFVPNNSSTLAFYALAPCRIVDTRGPNGPLGGPFLMGGMNRDFPVLASSCGLPKQGAQAYSFNITAVPHGASGYVTLCPTPSDPHQSCPQVSTLNWSKGQVTANAAIVPAGTGGSIRVNPSNDTDLLIDVNGYFAAPGGTGALSLYPVVPCRVLDTRPHPFQFELSPPVDVRHSPCAPPSQSQAYVFNATVVPQGGGLGYLTLWPDGGPQPQVSTLNAFDGAITSNMAIVPAGQQNGKIDAYDSPLDQDDPNDVTNLILDISGYFAP